MNKKALTNLIALGEGLTTEFKRSGTSGIRSAVPPLCHSRRFLHPLTLALSQGERETHVGDRLKRESRPFRDRPHKTGTKMPHESMNGPCPTNPRAASRSIV